MKTKNYLNKIKKDKDMILDVELFLRLFLATVAGGLIGFERKVVHKPAGLRTHMLVCMGSALFAIMSITIFVDDQARMIAGVITGIGFLGAGTIFRAENHVKGLTTAASLWSVAAIGIAMGIGEYYIAAAATLLVILILWLNKINFFREV